MDIDNHQLIIVYMKKGCPYCAATRALLESKEIKFTEIDIKKATTNRVNDKVLFEEEHLPKIYIDNLLIGGYQQLVELIAKGNLK